MHGPRRAVVSCAIPHGFVDGIRHGSRHPISKMERRLLSLIASPCRVSRYINSLAGEFGDRRAWEWNQTRGRRLYGLVDLCMGGLVPLLYCRQSLDSSKFWLTRIVWSACCHRHHPDVVEEWPEVLRCFRTTPRACCDLLFRLAVAANWLQFIARRSL